MTGVTGATGVPASHGSLGASRPTHSRLEPHARQLWVDLVALNAMCKKHNGALPLPVMKNEKTVDPRDKASTAVLQAPAALLAPWDGPCVLELLHAYLVPLQRACTKCVHFHVFAAAARPRSWRRRWARPSSAFPVRRRS